MLLCVFLLPFSGFPFDGLSCDTSAIPFIELELQGRVGFLRNFRRLMVYSNFPVNIEASADHIHLTEAHFKILFGENAEPTILKELSLDGNWAAQERVRLVGSNGKEKWVRLLLPFRPETQVEISTNSSRKLGFGRPPPIRESGVLDGSAPFTIIGPEGELSLPQGLIRANLHIHLAEHVAIAMGITDKQVGAVVIDSEVPTLFENVVFRVHKHGMYGDHTVMHIDTDQANAIGLLEDSRAYIVVNK